MAVFRLFISLTPFENAIVESDFQELHHHPNIDFDRLTLKGVVGLVGLSTSS